MDNQNSNPTSGDQVNPAPMPEPQPTPAPAPAPEPVIPAAEPVGATDPVAVTGGENCVNCGNPAPAGNCSTCGQNGPSAPVV